MKTALLLEIKGKTPEQTQGLLIRRVRENLEMTQRELGKRVGLSQMRISQIEGGSGTSSVLIYRIARALGREPNDFEV